MPRRTPPELPVLQPGETMLRKPPWLKVRAPGGENYARLKAQLKGLSLHTVCEEAQCPNLGECWSDGTATVMILGELCTRACRFCAVKAGKPNGEIDRDEPRRVAEAIASWGLRYVVITSVDRDDLADQGAGHFAETVSRLRAAAPNLYIEILTPDFRGDENCIRTVLDITNPNGGPHVFAHNIETVERLQPVARDARCGYKQSLAVLAAAKRIKKGIYTKSSIMLGHGELEGEVIAAMRDLLSAGVDFVTLGQYLRPSPWHLEVQEYATPEKFESFRERGLEMGFRVVSSGPLVRSSYRAGEFQIEQILADRKES
ncbi:MAG: lipoyl synthase [Planctomycetes bacterium]|nr:lipoyl synthase [Planctomycetota bacterium]